MANKTVDRKKAVPARSQAAKASPKNINAKAAQPSAATQARPSDRKPEKSAVLQVEEVESEEVVVEEEEETTEEDVEVVEEEDDEEEDVEEDEEEVVEEKPARRSSARARKERDLVTVSPQDYSVSRPTGSRFPNFPGSQFLRSSYRELRLVTWPSRRDTWNWTMVVVAVCIAVAILLGATDLALSKFVTWWLSLAH